MRQGFLKTLIDLLIDHVFTAPSKIIFRMSQSEYQAWSSRGSPCRTILIELLIFFIGAFLFHISLFCLCHNFAFSLFFYGAIDYVCV